ncbi:uncharacterized protein [Hyperolius riggenbachi]|uniref:uncharacterized protein n=1 Tax=Hyperolius riggenbachi TaxID=752182 RepID=UPI0035A2C15A
MSFSPQCLSGQAAIQTCCLFSCRFLYLSLVSLLHLFHFFKLLILLYLTSIPPAGFIFLRTYNFLLMDQTLIRLAAVARSEGGEELLKRILDAIAPAESSTPALLPLPLDPTMSPQQPLAAPAPTSLLPALPAVVRPPTPSKGRSRKDRHAQDLQSAAGAGAGYPEAPPAKRAKKPRRPYSPDVRGANSRSTVPTGSSRKSKGGSGRGQVTGGRHLAADLRSVCAPALSSAPSSQPAASFSQSAPAQCPQQPSSPTIQPAFSSAGTTAGIQAAPVSWAPPTLPLPVDAPSTSSSTSPPLITAADMPTPDQLAQHHLSGVLNGSSFGAACQSGAPSTTYSRVQGFLPASGARSAGTVIQDGRLPAATGEAVAGVRDSSSSDEETSLPRHGLKQVVWIIGHSFIFWARRRAKERPYTDNLDLDCDSFQIYWKGCRGMRWEALLPKLVCLVDEWPVPDILIIHLGGNDLGKVKTLNLLARMRRDFLQIRAIFPNTVLVFSEIVPRLLWYVSPNKRFFDKIRKRVNWAMCKFLSSVGGFSYRHIDLEGGVRGLYRKDLVHLSPIGVDIFNMELQNMVEKAVGWGARL